MADDETTEIEEIEETPEAEPVAETPELGSTESNQVPESAPEEDATPEQPAAKPSKSRRHVPRSERRTRTKVTREKPAPRKPIVRLEKPENELGRRQERRGVVVSDKGDKTIVVKVDVIKSHPKY